MYTTNFEKNTPSDMDGFLSNLVFLNNNNNNLLFQTMVHMEKMYMYNKIQIKGINK